MTLPRPSRTLAAVTAAALIGSGAVATAAGGPSPLAPSDGKTLTAGKQFTFKVRSVQKGSVFLKVAASKKKNKKGTLANDIYFRGMARKSGTIYTKKTESYPALSDYFLNKPGKYYWQAYRIDCAAQADCEVEGPIRSFRIK